MKRFGQIFFVFGTIAVLAASSAQADTAAGITALERGNIEEAVKQFEKAAAVGDKKAYYHLGLLLEKNESENIEANENRAFNFIRRAARGGVAQAAYKLGTMHMKGIGVPTSPKNAYRWFLKSANKDIVAGQAAVGRMHMLGLGTYRDLPTAFKWLAKAASQGDANAYDDLDDLYRKQAITYEQMLYGETPPSLDTPLSERAQTFKTAIQQMMTAYELTRGAQASVKMAGKPVVYELEGHMMAILPLVTLEGRSGERVQLGTIRVQAKELEDGRFEVASSLPGRIRISTASNPTELILNVGERSFKGIWSPEAASFTDFDLRLTDISTEFPASLDRRLGMVLQLDDLHLTQSSKGIGDVWDIKRVTKASGFRVIDRANQACCFEVNNLNSTSTVTGLRLAEYRTIIEQIGIDPITGLWRPDILAKGPRIPEDLPPMFDSLKSESTITGLSVTNKSGTELFKIAEGQAVVSIRDSAPDHAIFNLAINVPDMILAGDSVPKSLAVNRLQLFIAVENIPTAPLKRGILDMFAQLGTMAVSANAENAGALQSPKPLDMSKLTEAIFGAQTIFKLNSFVIGSGSAEIAAEGQVVVDGEAERKIVGRFTIQVAGLKDAQSDPTVAAATGGLSTILADAFEGREVKENGRSIMVYDIEIPKQGPVLINGKESRKGTLSLNLDAVK